MDKTQPLDDYWIEVPDLTIYHAAFWMQLGGDPRNHEERCEIDDQYNDSFYQHPGGYEAVCNRTDSLFRAIDLGMIHVKDPILGSDGTLDFKRTRILKSDWLHWCRTNGNSQTAELADRFEDEKKITKLAESQTTPNEPLRSTSVSSTGITQHRLSNRTNLLDPAIDKAINHAGTLDTAAVFLKLKDLAMNEEAPFTGNFNGGALCYTNAAGKLDKLTKGALAKRLRRRTKKGQ